MTEFPNPNNFDKLLGLYGQHLAKQGKCHAFITSYTNPCRQFIQFVKEKGIDDAYKVEKVHFEEFQTFLYHERDFKRSSVVTFIKVIHFFFDFLIETRELSINISREVEVMAAPVFTIKQLAHYYTFEEILRRYSSKQQEFISFNYLNEVKKHLNGFFKYLIANELSSVYVVTEATLLKYRIFLWEERVQMKTTSLVAKSQMRRLRCIVRLFRYLHREGILKANPVQNIEWESYYKEILEREKTLPDEPVKNRDLTELEEFGNKFCKYQLDKGRSPHTIKSYRKGLEVFFEFLDENGIQNLSQVTKRHTIEYFNFLCSYIGNSGNSASNSYKNHLLWSMKLFFRYLHRCDYLNFDPAADLESFKEQRGLPHTCMSEKEVDKLLALPALTRTPQAIRDKAILEVLYSTGIRCNELCQLDIGDIDYRKGFIRINHPKGGDDFQRVIPIGHEAIKYVQLYLKESRPVFQSNDPKALFISYAGQRLHNEGILNIVKKYAHLCGIRKRITTHSFRVTCATSLHNNGADILHIQKQLGHRRLNSTERYTRLQPIDLKRIHNKCHPREKKHREEEHSGEEVENNNS